MIDTTILIAASSPAGTYFRPRPMTSARYGSWPGSSTSGSIGPGPHHGSVVSMDGRPGRFPELRLEGYSEAMLLYVLGLGSPPTAARGKLQARDQTYQWENLYDIDFLFAAPLFIHQLSHLWIDFRGIQTSSCGRSGSTTSRTAAARPSSSSSMPAPSHVVKGYGENCWASPRAGPGFSKQRAAGASSGSSTAMWTGSPLRTDDGTLAPWAAVASLPSHRRSSWPRSGTSGAPIRRFVSEDGLLTSFNPASTRDGRNGCWLCPEHYGLDQGRWP